MNNNCEDRDCEDRGDDPSPRADGRVVVAVDGEDERDSADAGCGGRIDVPGIAMPTCRYATTVEKSCQESRMMW